MPTRPDSPDPAGASAPNPFAQLGAGLAPGLSFLQDWWKAAGSSLPGQAPTPGNGVPSWGLPTLDPQELDKRIQDLKTVQFWLEQNARMIGMTIQGLEVQRMTLSTLQKMNVSMDHLKDALKVDPAHMASAFQPTNDAPAAQAPAPADTPPLGPDLNQRSAWFQGAPEQGAAAQPDATTPESPADLINPMRWWDTLTQQFSHLATQAAQTAQTAGQSLTPQPPPSPITATGGASRRPRKAANAHTSGPAGSDDAPAAPTASTHPKRKTPRKAQP